MKKIEKIGSLNEFNIVYSNCRNLMKMKKNSEAKSLLKQCLYYSQLSDDKMMYLDTLLSSGKNSFCLLEIQECKESFQKANETIETILSKQHEFDSVNLFK